MNDYPTLVSLSYKIKAGAYKLIGLWGGNPQKKP
jgi:hypothetical protein